MERAEAGEVLRGLTIFPLPRGGTPLEAVVLVKYLREDGTTGTALRFTEGLDDDALIGLTTESLDVMRRDALDKWVDSDDDGDAP